MVALSLGGLAFGVLLYLLLCTVAILAGCGLLQLLKIETRLGFLLFAPVVTLVFWSLSSGIAGGMRIPIKNIWLLIWGATALLATIGLPRFLAELRFGYLTLLICISIPILTMLPYFWNGLVDYLGSTLPDGWSYIAFGQYLWEYPRGAQGGLAPLYQYATHLSNTRFVSAGLLGLFSPLVHAGDTQSVSGLFQAWALFSGACAVALFWTNEKHSMELAIVATVLSTLAGWIVNLVWANNFDNQLALVYLPVFAAMLNRFVVRDWHWWLLLALFGATLVYTYPELSFFVLGCVAFFAFERFCQDPRVWKSWGWGFFLALVVVLVLLLPIQNLLFTFLQGQFQIALSTTTARPGEGLFPGLVEYNFQPAAFWGLGSEQRFFSSLTGLLNGFGIALTIVATMGLGVVWQQRRWGLVLTVIGLTSAAIYYIVFQRYSYAAYKMIVLNWWCLAGLLVMGFNSLLNRMRLRPRTVTLALALLVLGFSANTYARLRYYGYQSLDVSQFRNVNQAKEISQGGPIRILVDDWIANEWAVYYLRDVPVYLTEYRMYMAQAHVVPFMQNATPVDSSAVHHVLTDTKFSAQEALSRGWQKRWSDGAYILWQTE